jgi:retinoid hydroxylase
MSLPFDRLPVLGFPPNSVIEGTLPSFMARSALEHGPIFALHTDTEGDFVFMVGPEANRFVMHTHREHFSHRDGWTPVIGDWSGVGLLNMDPPDHTVHRRLMNPAFTSSYLASYLPLMDRVIADRTADWVERDAVDLQEEAREIAFDVAAVALVGLQSGRDVDRLRQLFVNLLHGFDSATQTWDEFVEERKLTVRDLDELLLDVVAKRRRVPDAEQPRDVLARIVHARDDQDHELTDEQLVAHVKILLVAGHETTTSLAARVLFLLAARPDDRARVEAETAALGVSPNAEISIDGLRSLKFLDTFIREVGRLYAPVLNVPRGVVKDFEFGGYSVPVGTQIRLGIAACHRLPTVFQNPEVFDPSRFEPPRDEDAKTPYGLVTFGGGPRTCIGMSFAQVEVKALVAHVLRNVRLEPLSDRALVHAGFWTSFAPEGVMVRASPRG